MGNGLETDMQTGDPLLPRELLKESREQERRLRTMERHAALVNDLAGGGGPILRLVASRLAARIDVLIAADTEATTLLTILRSTQQVLAVGERLAADDLQQIFQREGLTGL
jgi:hypothetical protein